MLLACADSSFWVICDVLAIFTWKSPFGYLWLSVWVLLFIVAYNNIRYTKYLIDLHNTLIMGFSGAEAFRGTSAPTLKTEVSGKGDNGLCYCPFFSPFVSALMFLLWFVYLTHNIPFHYLYSTLNEVTSNSNRVILDSEELNAASTVSERMMYHIFCYCQNIFML